MNQELDSNTNLSHYRIISKIGAGGMGEVYLAQDTRLDRNVALKILPAELAANGDRMERFVREAKSAAALNHPNIAHIYEIGEHLGTNFIAMEFIDGQTLREKIHRERTELKKLLKYLQQVAEALSKAHSAGIVHRDLKPDNIMITYDGHTKILDFGLAKLVESQTLSGLTADSSAIATAILQQLSTPGAILGTAGYMSPEQALGKTKEIDQRSDIFSFGCILYEAVTGHKAFEGKDTIDSLNKIIREPFLPIIDFRPDAPNHLQRVVRRCLAKDREDRYQTIKDVAIELRELRRELEGVGVDTTVPPARSETAAHGAASKTDETGGAPTGSAAGSTFGPASSAEYLVAGVRQHKLAVAIVAIVFVLVCVGLGLSQLARNTEVAVVSIAVLVVMVGLSLGLYARRKPSGPAPFVKLKVSRVTSSGKASGAAISPDGRYIVHVVDNAERQSLELRQVATNTNQEIVASAAVHYSGLTFSPDGNYIYYGMRERTSPSASLYRKPVLGGEATKILTSIASHAALSPDGRRLAFLRRENVQGEMSVMLANIDGTGEQKIASRKPPDFYRELAWSPDGKVIALSAGTFKGNFHGTVVTVPVTGGPEKLVTSQTWFGIGSLGWLGDGSGLILSAEEQSFGVNQLWYIAYSGGEVRQVTHDLNIYDVVSLTADSNALIAVQRERSANIWVAPVSLAGPPESIGEEVLPVDASRARQITSGSSKLDGYYGVSWTPDGRLTYTSAASGTFDIWIMLPDGSSQKQLTSQHQESVYRTNNYHSVSPDGRYIVFTSDRTGNPHVWRMDVDGSNLKQLTSGTGEGLPKVTPDGQAVVYVDFSTKGVLWKVSIDGGDPTQLTDRPANKPTISPNGKFVACSYLTEPNAPQKLAVIPIEGGAPVKLFDLSPGAGAGAYNVDLAWTPDGRALVYIDTQGGISNLWAQLLDGGAPVRWTDFKSDRIFWFDFSSDGRQVALVRGNSSTDVVLFSNLK